MKQTTGKIRIASGFMSALDRCPDCGDEHDVAQEVKCHACGYHAGSDLSEEWLGHVEEEMKDIPAGVELEFAHEAEAGDSDYHFDFSVAPSADRPATLKFFERIAGGATGAVIIDSAKCNLDALTLNWCCWLEMARNYSAPPRPDSGSWRMLYGSGRYAHVTRLELLRIQREIEDGQSTAREGDYECDSAGVAWALQQFDARRTVWVGQDEDGYYFGAEVA